MQEVAGVDKDRSGLWSDQTDGSDMSQKAPTGFTSPSNNTSLLSEVTVTRSRASLADSRDTLRIWIESAKQLYTVFLRKADKLLLDGSVKVNGSVSVTTQSGATLTRDNVIAALKRAYKGKREADVWKAAAVGDKKRWVEGETEQIVRSEEGSVAQERPNKVISTGSLAECRSE